MNLATDPRYHLLREEVDKLGALAGAAVDWPRVARLAADLAQGPALDLQVLAYAALARVRLEGPSAAALEPLRGALAGPGLLTPARPRARASALEWLLAQLLPDLTRAPPDPGSAALADALRRLRAAAREALGDLAPSFGPILAAADARVAPSAPLDFSPEPVAAPGLPLAPGDPRPQPGPQTSPADQASALLAASPQPSSPSAQLAPSLLPPAAGAPLDTRSSPPPFQASSRTSPDPPPPPSSHPAPQASPTLARDALTPPLPHHDPPSLSLPAPQARPSPRDALTPSLPPPLPHHDAPSLCLPAPQASPTLTLDALTPPPAPQTSTPLPRSPQASPNLPSDASPSAGAPPGPEPLPALAADLDADLQRALEALGRCAHRLRDLTPADPRPIRLLRAALWHGLHVLPRANPDRTTGLVGLDARDRELLADLDARACWPALLARSENLLAHHRLALDLQRHSARALVSLGAASAGLALRAELAALLTRLPGLLDLRDRDGVPLADPHTRRWLLTEVLPASPARDEDDLSPDLVRRLAGRERAPALADAQRRIAASPSGRVAWRRRLALAEACEAAGDPLAGILFAALAASLRPVSLEDHDPELAVRSLAGLLRRAPAHPLAGSARERLALLDPASLPPPP